MYDRVEYTDGIGYEWVTGKYMGDRAAKVADLAYANTGYFIQLDEGKGTARVVVAAFKRPTVTQRPDHLLLIENIQKIEELEKWYKTRANLK